MGARQAAASTTSECRSPEPGRPAELAPVRRALALRPGRRASPARTLGDSAAALPEHLHQPRGGRGGRPAREAGRPAAGLEGLRRRADRGDRPSDGLADRRGSRARRAGAQRRPGLALAAARGVLRAAGGLSRPPGQVDRGDRPRGRIDPRRPRGGLHAAARDDALGPGHRPAEGPRPAAGRADGRLARAPPGGPRATSTAAAPSSTARCTGPTRTTRTTSTWCSTRDSLGLEIAAEIVVQRRRGRTSRSSAARSGAPRWRRSRASTSPRSEPGRFRIGEHRPAALADARGLDIEPES